MTGPRVGVDVGGTFTDVALLTEDGALTTVKVPTTTDQSDGVLDGLLAACERSGVEPAEVAEFAHATTVAVNALLERAGARTALVTTGGFRDVLEIGRQDRPALYDLFAEKPAPLMPRRRRFELDERTTPEGVRTPVEEEDVRRVAAEIDAAGAESVAVALLHAYADPDNERRAAGILRAELDVPVTASHEVLPEFREYERTATAAADAYVTPAIDAYLGRLIDRVRDRGVPAPRIMQSNGGTAPAAAVRKNAVSTVLSGPAAGVVGARRVAGALARDRNLDGLVTFDMGGTSSDVSLVRDGEIQRTADAEIGDAPIRVPAVDVETVGSGGGSIARIDAGGALRVGPESAGADPGPACYGRGGERPTVTDAALVLGYIGADAALGGELALDAAAARDVLESLAAVAPDLDSALGAARGVHEVAVARMTRAIRSVTVERGHDPRTFGLVAFGGAGPLHAARLAANLGIGTVAVPLPAGVLSAHGLLAADGKHDAVRTRLRRLDEAEPDAVEAILSDLVDEALADVRDDDRDRAAIERSADLRYAGQSFELTVPVGERFDPDAARERFREAHERAYGYAVDEPAELVTLRVTATVERSVPDVSHEGRGDARTGTRTAFFDGDPRETAVYDRPALPVGAEIEGPAVLEGAESTTLLPPGWDGEVQTNGTVLLAQR